ncbi:MAG: HEAT repeat domain-containing protein [Haloarculaceae archaeon]
MSLYELERTSDVQELIGYARRSDNPEIRARAAELLGNFPEHDDRGDVVNALVSVAQGDDHGAVTAAAVDALDRLGGDAIEQLIADAAGADLDGDGADWVKARAFARALSADLPELRMAAANGLGQLEHTDAVPQLVERFADPDPRVRARAARACGLVADPRATAALEGLLTDEATVVRRTAVYSLVELLANVPTEQSHEIRETVVDELSETDDPSVVVPLVEILEESQQRAQRRNTAWLLGRVTEDAERDRVVEALVEVGERAVLGSTRPVLEVEHAVDGTSVQTHISGSGQHVAVLESLVSKGPTADAEDVDLSDAERQVLMALYSGVSPFEIPGFVGMDVAEVEDVFDRLVEAGVLSEKRVRRDVRLKARGRNIASEAIADQ